MNADYLKNKSLYIWWKEGFVMYLHREGVRGGGEGETETPLKFLQFSALDTFTIQ